MTLSTGLIQADLLMARHAIDDYKSNPRLKDMKNMAAYHLQQAAEKLIKIQIYRQESAPDYHELLTHNLGVLMVYAEKHKLNVCVPSLIRVSSAVITNWEAGSRYDLHFSIRINTLEKYMREIEKWYHKVYDDIKDTRI